MVDAEDHEAPFVGLGPDAATGLRACRVDPSGPDAYRAPAVYTERSAVGILRREQCLSKPAIARVDDLATGDTREAFRAFFAGREPRFEGR
jgi:hypothetical protein